MMIWLFRNPVWTAAAVGLVVPAYWGALGMLLFTLPSEVRLLDIAEKVTYPPRMWDQSWPPLVGPTLNAGLYAAACVVLRLIGGRSISVSREQPVVDVGRKAGELDRRELQWSKAAAAAGLIGSFLLVRPWPRAPIFEIVGGTVVFGLVLGIFVYIFLLMGRLFAWSLTTENRRTAASGDEQAR